MASGVTLGYLFLLLILTGTSTELGSRTSASKESITIGIYSPSGDVDWQTLVTTSWRSYLQDLHPGLDVRFVACTEEYSITVRNLQTVRSKFNHSSVSAIIGPYHPLLELLSQDERLPYVTVTAPPDGGAVVHIASAYTHHMIPAGEVIHAAVLDVVQHNNWTGCGVLYEEDSSGLRLAGKLMALSNVAVTASTIEVGDHEDKLRDSLLIMRHQGVRNFLAVCESQCIELVMRVALRLSMLSQIYSWIVVNLDPNLMDFQPYLYTLVRYTTFQYYHSVNSTSMETTLLYRYGNTTGPVSVINTPANRLPPALASDALRVVVCAVDDHLATRPSGRRYRQRRDVPGDELNKIIKQTNFIGETGSVVFDSFAHRENVSLNVVSLTPDGLKQIGVWDSAPSEGKRLKVDLIDNKAFKPPDYPLGKGIVRIVTIVEHPFVMHKKDFDKLQGNDRYEGYLIDLIALIAEHMKFEYELYDSPDGNYGSRNDEGEWNGMIRELIIGNASMCLGAISITSEREGAVDFAKPYKQKQINFLMKKPAEKTSIFQFLWPLSTDVWLLTVSSMLVVGFMLFIMDRFSPNSDQDKEGRFNLRESLWFIYGSLVGAGTEMVPRTVSGRLLSGAWWFFGLILISSYTANLAAFLTVTKIETPIKSVAELAAQTKIKYGTVRNTYTSSMFRKSDFEIFQKMWLSMSKLTPDSMVTNSEEGLQKVKEGNFAFIWDSPINKYTATRECDTMAVGEPFDEKGYGIGVPLGAAYRDVITMTTLGLSELGEMRKLDNKWWGGGECEEFKESSTSGTKELKLDNVAGVFVVVAVGALAALVACVFEYLYRRSKLMKKKPREDGDSVGTDGSSVPLRPSLYINSQNNSAALPAKESNM